MNLTERLNPFVTRRAAAIWGLTLLSLLWFDVAWCSATTFTAMSMPETWVNALLLSTLLSLPQLLAGASRTQAAVITVVCLWLEANLLYSRTYFSAIPLSSYLLVGNLGDFTASVTDSLRTIDAGFAAIIAAAWGAALRSKSDSGHPTRQSRVATALWIAAMGAVSGGLIAARGGYSEAWRSLENANYHSCRTPMYTVAGWLVHDATTSLAPLSDADRAEVAAYLADNRRITPLPDSVAAPRSLVLILCESLESWPIGLTIEGKEITPNLNRLVADTTAFYAPQIITQVGAGRSIDGQLLISTGLQPMVSGVYAMSHIDNNYPSLAKAMKPARSYLLTVDKPVTWNQVGVARAFGIDTLISRDSWVNDEPVGARRKLGDRSFMRQIAAAMADGRIWPEGERAMVEIITYSGHNPFVLPDEYDTLRLTGDYDEVVRNYLTMAHYTDAALGIIVDYIRSRSDAMSTLIAITGDHEGLAAYRGDASRRHSWVSSAQATPLIVVNAPHGCRGRFDYSAGQADIYPTLLKMLGLASYGWHGLGESMLSATHPRIAVGSQGDITGDTTAAGADAVDRLKRARRISDMIITHDLLRERQ